ncbi:unnamed protein product [Hermetia illucens]|uniref:Uncharacterized protein n=1 Tax=Hermetia illucens TaxID=343691 RepID=A0A7R8UK77_HERIL|nr:unnamed protein product [Hermetia illucens]
MELFEYKITMCTNEERDLLSKLDECNAQFRLQETAQNQIEENKRLKKILDNYEMSLNEESSNQIELITQIEHKDSEIHGKTAMIGKRKVINQNKISFHKALNNQLTQAGRKLEEHEDELRRLQKLIAFERHQTTELEQRVKNLEILNAELQARIAQQDQNIRDNTEEILLLEKENSALEDQVKQTEWALQEKTNLLEHYAQDLRDVEEMRTRVVSIMKRESAVMRQD